MPTGIAHIQYGDHYPLVDPSEDIQFVLADMTVSYETAQFEYELPLKITRISPFGDLKLVTAETNHTVLDTQTDNYDYQVTEKADYTIHSWSKTGVSVNAVINNQILTRLIEPKHAILDLRTTFCVPPHVRTLSVTQKHGQETPVTTLCAPNIQLTAGYNCQLSSEKQENFRSANILSLNAVAGAGKGAIEAACGASAEPGLRSINGVRPDENGALTITTKNGLTLGTSCGVLSISGTNRACCSCEDMESFGRYVNKVTQEYHKVGAKAVWLRDKHNELVQKWNEIPAAGTAVVSSNTNSVPMQCPFFQIRVSVTNTSPYLAKFIKMYGETAILSAEHSDNAYVDTTSEEVLEKCTLKLVSQTISNYEYETTPVPEHTVKHVENEDGTIKKVTTINLKVLKGANMKFKDVRDENIYAVWSNFYDNCATVSPLYPEDGPMTEAERVSRGNQELETAGTTKSQQLFEHWYTNNPYMEWFCVPAGGTVYWTGIYRLILPTEEVMQEAGSDELVSELPSYVYNAFAERYRLQFTLTTGHIDFDHNSGIPLRHRMFGGLYLTGSKSIKLTMHCDQTLDDVLDGVTDKDDAETIRSKIYDLKKQYWPCPEETSENA